MLSSPFNRPPNVTPTASPKGTASVPVSPYPGLSNAQIKKLNAAFTKTDTKVNTIRDVLATVGVDMMKEEVVQLVGQWADSQPEIRTFSTLNAQDCSVLCPTIHNFISINNKHLSVIVPDSVIPTFFLPNLRMTRMVTSRKTEMGTRAVINIFLDTAVYVARQVFSQERLHSCTPRVASEACRNTWYWGK